MHVKNKNYFSKWAFTALDPSGKDFRIPREGYENSLNDLVNKVFSQLKEFDTTTNGEYLSKARSQARKHDLELRGYIQKVVEHQVCLNSPRGACYDDGFGDTLHSFAVKIDSWIDSMGAGKKVGETIVKVATFLATGKAQRKLSECGRCGGTRKFEAGSDNLGRAGTLNKL